MTIHEDLTDLFLAKRGKREIAYIIKEKYGTKFNQTYKYLKRIAEDWSYRSEVIIGKVTRDARKPEPSTIEVRFWIISDHEIQESELWQNWNKLMKKLQIQYMQFDFSSFRELSAEYNMRVKQKAENEYRAAIRFSGSEWYEI